MDKNLDDVQRDLNNYKIKVKQKKALDKRDRIIYNMGKKGVFADKSQLERLETINSINPAKKGVKFAADDS